MADLAVLHPEELPEWFQKKKVQESLRAF